MTTTKTITAEREGNWNITLEYSDGTERTFDGIRRLTTNDVGVVDTPWAVVLVAINDRVETWIVDLRAEALQALGWYFLAKLGTIPKITVCKCELSAAPKPDAQDPHCDEQSMAG